MQKICLKPLSSNLSVKSIDPCVWTQALGCICSLTSRLRNTNHSPGACVIHSVSTQGIIKNGFQNSSVPEPEVTGMKCLEG